MLEHGPPDQNWFYIQFLSEKKTEGLLAKAGYFWMSKHDLQSDKHCFYIQHFYRK
jgi:hypothetical protein